jgi:pimeloyl-ACP methyl ester carboxylesterase
MEMMGIDQQFYVAVGPPMAELFVSVIEPQDRTCEPVGTILVIHGIRSRSAWMLSTARGITEAGYRAVLVDLRGHGRSTGEYLTYGVQEAKDLSKVIDELAYRGLLVGPLGVFGISYGATSSIQLAGFDSRVQAVVAVAPFSNMREEVPHYLRTAVPGGKLVSDETFQKAIDESGRRAGFDPDFPTALQAIQETEAPVLLMHGTDDWLVPRQHSEKLHAIAPDHTELILLPREGHCSIWFDIDGDVQRATRAWFDRYLLGRNTEIILSGGTP